MSRIDGAAFPIAGVFAASVSNHEAGTGCTAIVCPDCYRDLTGGSSKAPGSFLAHHWHISYTLILITAGPVMNIWLVFLTM